MKKYKKETILLQEKLNPKVSRLHELYKEDKYLARVSYMNDSSNHENFHLYHFTEENGDFSIVLFRERTGISKTNKMYRADKRLITISYKKKGNKFWFINNSYNSKYVNQLTLSGINQYFPHEFKEKVLDVLQEKFSWVGFLREKDVLPNVSFNTIVSKKIYSFKKALNYTYNAPYPIGKILHKHKYGHTKYMNLVKHFIHYREYMINIESLKSEWVDDENNCVLFHDSLKMAKTLGKLINCSWSTKRLKSEHNKWATEITDIVFIQGDREMEINPSYFDFENFSGYKLIKTTKEMAMEGRRQNHCVATYVGQVESGNCGIFVVGDYTLELRRGYSGNFTVGQLRGYSNVIAPEEFNILVKSVVDEFNESIVKDNVNSDALCVTDDLPF